MNLTRVLRKSVQTAIRCTFSLLVLFAVILMMMVNLNASAQTPGCADLFLDGYDDYVSVASSPAYSTTFTIEGWIKTTSTGTEKNIASWGSQSANNHNVQFRMDGTKLNFGIWDGSTWNQLVSNAAINTGNWVHVAVVRVGTSVTLYINGVADISGTVNGSATVDKFQIGRFIQQGTVVANSYFPGNIQDLRIWTTARTATEINTYKAILLSGTESGLSVNYKMREGTGLTLINSVTGNAYPGTLTNGASWNAPVALEFNGSTNYISFATSPAYNSTFTLEAWIKSTSSAIEREIASWGNTGTNHNVQFRMNSGKLEFGIFDGSNWSSTSSSGSINTGNWMHVAVVKNGTNVTLYINGVADATGTNNTSPTLNQFEIGNWIAAGNQQNSYFPGNIRDVRVWNVARTVTEINTNKAAILAGTETGLVRYFKINEGTGSAITNSVSGGAYPGVINNTANWNPTLQTLAISSQSTEAQTQCINLPLNPLSVTVSSNSAALSYQWYSNASASNSGGVVISGATLPNYTPLSLVAGTQYYYCTVSNGACYSITSAVSGASVVTADCIPSITTFTPASATTGNTVTIIGVNLGGATAVSFGGTAVSSFKVVSATIITAVIASGATGSVSVTTTGGTATAPGFTYLISPSISYTGVVQIFPTNAAISPLNPTNTGSAISGTFALATTFAGSGTQNVVDATGTAASFVSPTGIAADAVGNIYVSEELTKNIRKITPGGVVTTFAGSGSSGSTDATGTSASFSKPNNLATDAAGNLYVADYNNQKIRKITPQGVVTTLAGNGSIGSVDGTGIAASFSGPTDLDVDAIGNIFVLEDIGKIRRITPAGVVTTFSFSFASSAEGKGTKNGFYSPKGMAIDAAGNLYVTDNTNNTVHKITAAGVVTTLAGSGASGSLDGMGSAATFNGPSGIAVDAGGNLYIADAMGSKIRKITPAGMVTTLAGSGSPSSADGIGAAASFKFPLSLVISSGKLYVAEYFGYSIRQIELSGYIISPALPAGLSMDPSTGIISGTPTTTTGITRYTITGTNSIGSSTTTVSIGTGVITPTITSFTPAGAATGTRVTITGTFLSGATAVSFGGTPATSFTETNVNTITAIVASGTTGSVTEVSH